MERPYDHTPTETELLELLEQIVERDPSLQSMGREVRAGRYYVDLLLDRNGTIVFVEVKKITPQTDSRISEMLEQLRNYRTALARQFPGRELRGVLAITGVLSADKVSMLAAQGFELWDKRWIIGHAMEVGLDEYAYSLFGDTPRESAALLSQAEIFQGRLRSLSCGRANWFAYQKLCGDILGLLFCPPLNIPIPESSTVSRVNRRDFVIPNYVSIGFWHFMRMQYRADYLVVDAKNHCGQANKTHALQLANYLSPYGTGLFGMIITRNGMDRGGMYTCREQWMLPAR
jgi:hypothetical protein